MKESAETISDSRKEVSSSSFGDLDNSFRRESAQLKTMLTDALEKEGISSFLSPLSFFLSPKPTRTLTVLLPHELFYRWISKSAQELLEKAVHNILGQIDIIYEWPTLKTPSFPPKKLHSPPDTRPSKNFDTFIPGGRNRETIQLFRQGIHSAQSPIFLHGPSGTGKTHLLLAAAHELKSITTGRILFFSARKLISLFQTSSSHAFADLCSCAAVLIDDLQLLEQYPEVQKELAALLDSRKNMILIAAYQTDGYDESGQKLLPLLYDRLCSQLSLGLAEPDLDVRLRFTQDSMENLGLPENRDIALFLARHCLRLRHISGVLKQLSMRYEQFPVLPDPNELSLLLGKAGTPQPVDTNTILAVVASRYGCTSSELCENTKDRRIILPRQIAMYLCRELMGESYPSLGLLFGGKDHSTVMYAIKKIEKLKVTNKDMNIQLTELTKQCRNGLQRREN